MASDRVQHQIDRLSDEAETTITSLDWRVVRDRVQAVLRLDPGKADALAYLSANEKAKPAATHSLYESIGDDLTTYLATADA